MSSNTAMPEGSCVMGSDYRQMLQSIWCAATYVLPPMCCLLIGMMTKALPMQSLSSGCVHSDSHECITCAHALQANIYRSEQLKEGTHAQNSKKSEHTCRVSSEGSRRECTSVTAAMCITCSAHANIVGGSITVEIASWHGYVSHTCCCYVLYQSR